MRKILDVTFVICSDRVYRQLSLQDILPSYPCSKFYPVENMIKTSVTDPVHPPLLTIAIPTCNRGEILQHVCEALLQQTVSADKFIVLIVDNNSTDDTQQRMADMAKHFPYFSCIKERKAGSSHARNAAWQNCTTPWIAYIDDDSLPSPEFVDALLRTITLDDCDVIAGKVTPWKHSPLPSWFLDEYETYSPVEDSSGFLCPKDFAVGNNMTFRLSAIQQAGGFDPRFGVKGTLVPYGEETVLQIMIRKNGGKIRYVPSAMTSHLAKPSRYTVSNLLRISYFSGKSTPIIYNWRGWKELVRLCLKVPYRLALAIGKSSIRLYQSTYTWENAVITTVGECLFLVGMFRGFFWLMRHYKSE